MRWIFITEWTVHFPREAVRTIWFWKWPFSYYSDMENVEHVRLKAWKLCKKFLQGAWIFIQPEEVVVTEIRYINAISNILHYSVSVHFSCRFCITQHLETLYFFGINLEIILLSVVGFATWCTIAVCQKMSNQLEKNPERFFSGFSESLSRTRIRKQQKLT